MENVWEARPIKKWMGAIRNDTYGFTVTIFSSGKSEYKNEQMELRQFVLSAFMTITIFEILPGASCTNPVPMVSSKA